MKLLLASASSRRRELLQTLGHDVVVIEPNIIELSQRTGENDDHISLINAQIKARTVYANLGLMGREMVVSADTVVQYKDRFFGKPKNIDEAKEALTFLSNKLHEVVTSYCLIGPGGQEISRLVISQVEFRALSSEEIDAYLSRDEWVDKAGSYGVQGCGAALIRRVMGSITNVIGLPIEEFLNDAKKLAHEHD